MRLMCIAVLFRGKNKVGYRLYDKESNITKDVPLHSIVEGLKRGIEIENIAIENNVIKFIAGSEDRYAKVDINMEHNKCRLESKPLVVLGKSEGGSIFKVVNYKGQSKLVREIDVIQYGYRYGLANAKIVKNGKTEFISAINKPFDIITNTNNIGNKRFVLIYYEYDGEHLSKPTHYGFYDILKDRMLHDTKMMALREKSGCAVIKDYLYYNTDGKIESNNTDVFPIISEQILNSFDSYVIVKHYIKEDEVVFLGVTHLGGRREFNIHEVVRLAMTNSKEIIVRYEELKNGDIAIITGSTVYKCKNTIVNEVRQMYKNVDKLKSKQALVGTEYMEIDSLGRLNKIYTENLSEDITRVKIPSAIKVIKPEVIFDSGHEGIELIIGENVTDIGGELRNKDIRLSAKYAVESWGKVVCKSKGIINCLCEACELDESIENLFIALTSHHCRVERLETNVDITEEQYLSLIGFFKTIKCDCVINWSRVVQIIKNGLKKRCEAIYKDCEDTLKAERGKEYLYIILANFYDLYKNKKKITKGKDIIDITNLNKVKQIADNRFATLGLFLFNLRECARNAVERLQLEDIAVIIEKEKEQLDKILEKEAEKIAIQVVDIGKAQYIQNDYGTKLFIGVWFKVKMADNHYWFLSKNTHEHEIEDKKIEKAIAQGGNLIKISKLWNSIADGAFGVTEEEYNMLTK